MKVLIFSAGFFPGKKCGGPPVSVDNFCTLMNEFECYIVATDHDMGETQRYKDISEGWNDRVNAKVMYLTNHEYASRVCLEKIITEVKPDWLYFQSLFQKCVISGLWIAKKHGIKVLLAPRGELCAGAMKKKYKKVPYIYMLRVFGLTKNIHCQSTSDEETKAINFWLKIPEKRIHFLTNIPSIPKEEYKRKKKSAGQGSFVFLSRIHPKKNLLFALKCLMSLHGDVCFDIYGPLEDEIYWEECQNIIKEMPDNVTIKYCGLVSHDIVHKVFSMYDAFFFPTLSENYGHVIAEALMVGCPVVISDQTPWNDVNQFNAGKALPLSDTNSFSEVLQEIINSDNSKAEQMSKNAKKLCAEKMKTAEMHSEYLKVFLCDK